MSNVTNGLSQLSEKSGFNLRLIVFGGFTVFAASLLYRPLINLITTGYRPYYSHILLIPFVSAYFLFEQRKEIAQNARSLFFAGSILVFLGILGYALAFWVKARLGLNDFASLATASSLVFWWGGFVLAFGTEAFRAARFGLLFMLFMVPIPQLLLDRLIYVLQLGSTEITQWLFELAGMNYIREGFVYHLTGISIEVAKECSSIRSSIALIITGVLAGHLFLKSGWRMVLLLATMIPINIIKNGIRITTLSLLAVYVDRKFITDSFLHHSGGFIFYLPALGMMAVIVLRLRKGEAKKAGVGCRV